MRTLLKRAGIVFGSLIVLLLVIALLVDSKWTVKQSVRIQAPAEKIFPLIDTLRLWPTWTAWTQESYPDMTMEFSGPESGVGASESWNDGNMEGKIVITRSEPNRMMAYDLSMDNGTYTMRGEFTLAASSGETHVTWQVWGDSGSNLISRLMMLIYKPMMAAEFDQGLQKLKRKMEAPT